MKFMYVSILCSILLLNTCFAMNQSSSTHNKNLPHFDSTDTLSNWDTIIDKDDIPTVETLRLSESNKKSGWFSITTTDRNSFRNSDCKKIEPKNIELKQPVATIPLSIIATVIVAEQQTPISNISPDAPVIHQNISEPVKNNDQQALSTIITSPLQPNRKSYNNFQSNDSIQSDSDNDSTSSIITQMSEPVHQIETMNMQRDFKPSITRQNHYPQANLLSLFNNCCICFCHDLEAKKKSNK